MHTIKHEKAASFFDTFDRKGEGAEVSHYCPGCGHGTAHNLVAEALVDMELQDRAIFCAPVGCSVFTYYYFRSATVQCPHGRAPASASAIRRTHKDAIVISYQGDGDLAGIGMSHIIHAANRGENITVFFINNSIYGMTGGQMAPTTLVGQKTTTTPNGRSAENEGYPMGLSEMLSTLEAPVYIERVTLSDAKGVLGARKAIRKGLQNQVEKKGFSFIEILSPCPINWKMTPVEARKWMKANTEVQFPVGVYKNVVDEREPVVPFEVKPIDRAGMMTVFGFAEEDGRDRDPTPIERQEVKVAGFGGQGVMSAAMILANCAIAEGRETTWLPSYGPEMRGGTAYASVNIANETIGSPIVNEPNVLIAMNGPSLDAFEQTVKPGGLVLTNASLVKRGLSRDDVTAFAIPATDMAKELGALQAASIIMLAAYALVSGAWKIETLKEELPKNLKRKELVELNLKAIAAAEGYVAEHFGK